MPTMGPKSTSEDFLISSRKSAMAESAAWRISRFESESMLNRPSRKSGNQSSMFMSGTESSTIIQPKGSHIDCAPSACSPHQLATDVYTDWTSLCTSAIVVQTFQHQMIQIQQLHL
mmetsp:Transcript_32985/g.102280  ORF Transcript_32985/g.102280 Transcript_32985/m.102280 type:complete len:116 (+) Transcript_32985:1228-1575(+)